MQNTYEENMRPDDVQIRQMIVAQAAAAVQVQAASAGQATRGESRHLGRFLSLEVCVELCLQLCHDAVRPGRVPHALDGPCKPALADGSCVWSWYCSGQVSGAIPFEG